MNLSTTVAVSSKNIFLSIIMDYINNGWRVDKLTVKIKGGKGRLSIDKQLEQCCRFKEFCSFKHSTMCTTQVPPPPPPPNPQNCDKMIGTMNY